MDIFIYFVEEIVSFMNHICLDWYKFSYMFHYSVFIHGCFFLSLEKLKRERERKVFSEEHGEPQVSLNFQKGKQNGTDLQCIKKVP